MSISRILTSLERTFYHGFSTKADFSAKFSRSIFERGHYKAPYFVTKTAFSTASFPNHEESTMKKTRIFGLLFAAGSLFSLSIYAAQTKKEEPNSVLFSPIEGIKWVEKCIQQYPEILFLADSKVRKTEEGRDSLQGTYSEQLFGQKFVEFDRTIMTLHCMKLILDGSEKAYQEFSAAQPEAVRLSKESFAALHHQGQSVLKSRYKGMSSVEMTQALETALVLGDMGKSEKARMLFKPYNIKAPDHDDFYGEAMHQLEKNPQICPSFNRLPEQSKQLLVQIANLAHYGHVTHLEGGLSMFTKLKQSDVSNDALAFDLFVHLCDVAGALGHVNNKSSVVYTELTHRAMTAMQKACFLLREPNKTEIDAYNAYLAERCSWIGLDPANDTDRVLGRLSAMLRLFTIEEGAILKNGFQKLDMVEGEKVIAQLSMTEGRTPTYMPAVLVNLVSKVKLEQAIVLGLPFIAKVLEKHHQMLTNKEADPEIPLNFNAIAGIVKSDPEALKAKGFIIDKEGQVFLK